MWIYLILLFFSFVLTYIIKEIALKKSLLDIPNERSSHTIPTPRGGGLAIVFLWYVSLFYFNFTSTIDTSFFYAQLCGLLLLIVSFIDDIYSVNFKIRLFSQFLTAGTALFFLGGLQKIDLGFYCFENVYLCTLIAIIGIVWFINLYNFIDGIDGYSSMEAVFISLSVSILFSDKLILCLAFATLGFLFWNWQKAKIFMGDVGSTMLGFIFSIYAIYYQNTDKSSIVIWIILTSLFWFDATFTLFRRYRNKERLSQAHKKHAYQRIIQAGFSHQKTVIYAIIINLGLFLLTIMGVMNSQFLLFFLVLSVLILFLVVKQIDKMKSFN